VSPSGSKIAIILVIGVLSVSTASIFIRLAMTAAGVSGVGFSLFLAASRLILASIVLLPNLLKLRLEKIPRRAYILAGAAGMALSLHFATWITSLSYTSVTASTVIATTNPIWVSLLSWLIGRETISRLTLLGIMISLGGGLIIAWGGFAAEGYSNQLLGDFLALIGGIMASVYFLLGRAAQRAGLSTYQYVTVAYTASAIVLLPLPLFFSVDYFGFSPRVYLYVLLMTVFAQLIGHTSFNWALQWISPIIVTLAILFEPLGASVLAIILFREIPSPRVIYGSIVLLGGVAMAIIGSSKTS
jgi:drug/metabolite transporter (DMT)-like permease